jgi:hypothetical protein
MGRMPIRSARIVTSLLTGLLVLVAAGCAAEPVAGGTAPALTRPPTAAPERALPSEPPATAHLSPVPGGPGATAPARPAWLGTRALPERPDGLGEVQDTPPELVDRRFPPPSAEPVADAFVAQVAPVPDDVLRRSTWTAECPVDLAELRYLTMAFWGFDSRTYTGEMIVHADVADDVVDVFEQLYHARFPIEEMRVVAPEELDAPPTGDGNNTSAFVCRSTAQGESWSQHAYGLAIDINPFHNPYHRDDAVIPELASAYLDRNRDLPGMIRSGDMVTAAFAAIGWGWGGQWRSLKDWMHFSQSGR